jgi:hypothetical protein
MFASLLISTALLAQTASVSTSHNEAFRAAEARAGHDPGALIELALWCEARGLDADRLNWLARAVLIDPKNARARGLMGLVGYGRRWESPEAVSRRVRHDEDLTANLAQYQGRRAEVLRVTARFLDKGALDRKLASLKGEPELYVEQQRIEERQSRERAARAHTQLATWCEENGLKPEAFAHFSEASQLDPELRTPWEHLGCKKHSGRWMTEEQIAAEQRELGAQRHADRHWEPLLRRWRAWLREKSRRDEAEAHLAAVTDPRAVASIWRVFARGDAADQREALRLLESIDSPAATRSLVGLAVYSEFPDVQGPAIECLASRDSRDVVPMLIDVIRSPLRFKFEPPSGYLDYLNASRGTLVVEGRDSIVRRSYAIGAVSMDRFLRGTPQGMMMENVLDQRLTADVRDIERHNEEAERINAKAAAALRRITGESLGNDEGTWRNWWAEQQGYVYDPPKPEDKVVRVGGFTIFPHCACFAAGTTVQTFSGPRPIESICLGDRVLSQNTGTGELSYQPVIAVHHNLPSPTLRLTVAGETTITTGIHRFWKTGRGWVMARDLKPGDRVRVVGGTARVEAVAADTVQPVYNLDVAQDRDFFVGRAGLLVHDFSLVEPVPQPFDAPPNQAPASRGE